MTSYFYGVNVGKNSDTAVVGTSTNSTDVEVSVNGANVADKESVLIALNNLIDFIVKNPYTPL